jgi:predicted ATPase
VQIGRIWNIPSPVRSFTGRDMQLAALREQLEAGQRAALVPAAVLYGMGGIGKSQLARAYAHRYRDKYQLGWWIPAEAPLTTTTALAELAVRLGAAAELPQSPAADLRPRGPG